MYTELASYRIGRHSLEGIGVYALDGGMSAEYAVQEALASLSGGVAHTWEVQAPGLGPNPVIATRSFLREAIDVTIAAYDALGAERVYDTVVVGTGVSSASYVAQLLGAPFLPLHFLASARSIAQTQDALDGAAEDGLAAYATLAYDESMPTMAVAWLKMLELPAAYRSFLERHRVRRVVLIGTRGMSPHLARRPLAAHGGDHIAAGEVLVTSPDGGSQLDDNMLRRTIDDLDAVELEPEAFRITDWESGLAEEQLDGVLAQLWAAHVETWLMTADDYLAAYDAASYAQSVLLRARGTEIRQLALNPYLITHPHAETVGGVLPLVYWQLDALDLTLDRFEHTLRDAGGLDADALRGLPVVINATLNVGGPEHALALERALRARGFTDVTTLDTAADEIYGDRADTPFWRAFDVLAAHRTGPIEPPARALEQLSSAIAHRTDLRIRRLDPSS